MERETGIEPATNSLEGCDSTTELLPQFARQLFSIYHASLGPGHRVPGWYSFTRARTGPTRPRC